MASLLLATAQTTPSLLWATRTRALTTGLSRTLGKFAAGLVPGNLAVSLLLVYCLLHGRVLWALPVAFLQSQKAEHEAACSSQGEEGGAAKLETTIGSCYAGLFCCCSADAAASRCAALLHAHAPVHPEKQILHTQGVCTSEGPSAGC